MAIFSSTVLDKIPILREFEIIIFDPTVSFKFTLFKNKLLGTILHNLILFIHWKNV